MSARRTLQRGNSSDAVKSPTLTIVKRSPSEIGHVFEACEMGCGDAVCGGKRIAMYEAELLGLHAAWLCTECAKLWAQTWEGASGVLPTRRNRRRQPRPAQEQEVLAA